MPRRTPQACYRAGIALGEFKRTLMTAHFAASEGAADVARELLKSGRADISRLSSAGLLSKAEETDLRAKLEEAVKQASPSMVERKAKYILINELESLEQKAKKACLSRR